MMKSSYVISTVVAMLLAAMFAVSALGGDRKPGRRTLTRGPVEAPQADFFEEYPLIEEAQVEERAESGQRPMSDEMWSRAGSVHLSQTAEGYDSLFSEWFERNVYSQYDSYFKTFIDLDSVTMPVSDTPDSVFIARLKMIVSPINLGFNEVVKSRIVAYTRWKGTVSKMLGLSQVYFPDIEEALCRHGLPVELRMLPVIESALNPKAISRAGAGGMWQFMYTTGKHFGLEVTSLVDQRFDPAASTEAACRYLKDLYGMYNDWTLALAAYNCGPGNVNKAIKRAGDKAGDFWSLYPYLPRETRGYVPAFIAATYAYTFHRQHEIEPTPPPVPVARDTIHVNRLMHFGQVSSTLDLPIELIRELNPQYKLDVIPAVDGRVYALTLPTKDIARYIDCEPAIQAKDSLYLADYLKRGEQALVAELEVSSQVHVVKSGDTLGAIARQYGVKVNQLMEWNGIKNAHTLRIGQKIQIFK